MKSGGKFFCCLFLLLFISSTVSAQQWDWVQRFQGDWSTGSSIGVDGSGNIYVAGSFTGTNHFGTNKFISAGGYDVFIVKLNPDGEVVWAISTGGPDDDGIRLIVATNGTVFVSGHFVIQPFLLTGGVSNASVLASNVFVARVDDGKFSWFDSFRPEEGGNASAIAFGPDQSVWVLGASNRVFLKHYSQNGTSLGGVYVGETTFVPGELALNRDGQVFVSGRVGTTVQLETNVVIERGSFIAGVDATGQVQWAGQWSGSYLYPIYGIACTQDGGVISVGSGGTDLPAQTGVIIKRAADGTELWRKARSAYFKFVFSANGVAVDSRGNVHVTGVGSEHLYAPRDRYKLWLLALDANGQTLSEQFVRSALFNDKNDGLAVAANADGDLFVAGYLMGTPTFGTNVMGDGPSGVVNGFVARLPTLQPALSLRRTRTSVLLDWPRTGLPFALQQSADLFSESWSNVLSLPQEVAGRRQVTLAAEDGDRFFRLKMTNEVPILHPPMIYLSSQPSPDFLERSRVLVASTNSVSSPLFNGFVTDPDDDLLAFQWFDGEQPLTNGTSASFRFNSEGRRMYSPTLNDRTLMFATGTHTISLVASDGTFHVTNSVTFEVLSVSTAIEELITAVDAANTIDRDWLIAPLQSAYNAVETGQLVLAAGGLQEFQTRLQASADLNASQKILFNDSAQTILNALPSE